VTTYFFNTTNSKIINVTANNNNYGIYVRSSSNNTLTNINANSNYYHGIYLYSNSSNNIITNITANYEILYNQNKSLALILYSPKAEYFKNSFYWNVFQAYVNELFETITYTFDTVNEMLLIGHNPSLTALTITLDVYREEIKPGEVLKIEFETDSWINIGKENAKFIWIEKPIYNNFLKI